MKIRLITFTMLLGFSIISLSCKKHKGCTDSNALNRDFSADINNGSCVYSKVTFYSNKGYLNGVAITKVDVKVNGNLLGSTGVFWPNGPGNCSAEGTVAYQFLDGAKVDWNSTIYLTSGGPAYSSGQVSPSSVMDCIKINVTP